MSENSTMACPVCGGPILSDDAACRRCGFKLFGATQAFKPITITPVGADKVSTEFSPVDPALYVVKGPQPGESFYLDRPVITVGRDPKCDIFLNDMTVSREHAMLTIEDGKVHVKDMNSLNGTWVDGAIVTEADLHDGSTLQIGTFSMVFHERPEF